LFFVATRADDRPPQICLKKKIDDVSFDVVAKKLGLEFFYQKICFSIHFDPKHLRNHDKPIQGLKKPKNHPKKQNKSEIKNQIKLIYVFS
jgi:hypothetical protein